MPPTTVTRRLAAIVIADVVGYTRLMERDDTGTFTRLRNIRDEVVDPAIVSHDGRIVKTAGDGLLAEFPSALAALRASVQIQREMAKRNEGDAAEERIEYRIGVNLGDIMIDGHDIAGDGVNVAARLEALAEPGDICVSGAVRDQVHGNLDVEFEDIGEQQVKNIARPIRVYRVLLVKDGKGVKATAVSSVRRRLGRWAWLVVACAAIGIGIVAMQQFSKSAVSPSPPPFSIAVLPFAAPSGSPAEEQLADGLTQELTTALGRWRLAHVASRGLVASYRGRAVDPRTVGNELSVRYVVEGEVGRAGDKTIVTMRVVDTTTGSQEWSDRMEFESALLNSEPRVMLMRTYAHLRQGIYRVETRRAVRDPDPKSALNLTLRGDAAWSALSEKLKGIREARRLYDEALRLDPGFVQALVSKIDALHWELYEDLDADRGRIVAEMDALSRRAIALDGEKPDVWETRGETLIWLGRWDEALAASAHAQALDPARYWYLYSDSWLLFATGRPAESIALTERANVIDPPGDPTNSCRVSLMLGRYREAVPACERAAALDDATWHNQVLLVAASAQNGEMQKAAVAKAELLKRQPGFSIAKDKAALLSAHPDYLKMLETHYYPGLRKAGIPEK
jgi:adenylate cyclase